MGPEARRPRVPSASRKSAARRPSKSAASKPTPKRGKPPVRSSKRPPARKPPSKAPAKPLAKAASKPKPKSGKSAPKKPAFPSKEDVPLPPPPPIRLPGGRLHVLSLSFLRDGDEFMARMETDAGQITELKNRSLDQLLTLVASELEDLLE